MTLQSISVLKTKTLQNRYVGKRLIYKTCHVIQQNCHRTPIVTYMRYTEKCESPPTIDSTFLRSQGSHQEPVLVITGAITTLLQYTAFCRSIVSVRQNDPNKPNQFEVLSCNVSVLWRYTTCNKGCVVPAWTQITNQYVMITKWADLKTRPRWTKLLGLIDLIQGLTDQLQSNSWVSTNVSIKLCPPIDV